MPAFATDFLAAATGGHWTTRPATPISGFTMDTRALRPGQAFVAIRTAQRDGHDFLAAAEAAGAAAAVVAAPRAGAGLPQLVVADPLAAFQAIAAAHRRAFPGPVIGVTGSAGKTSTKDLLTVLLGGGPSVLSTEGNLNNHLGVPLTLTRLDPAIHRFAVVEAGIAAPGEMTPLAAMIAPDLAIVTLVAPAHLAELGDLEGVAREKAALAAAVRPPGLAIFPASCAEFPAFRTLAGRTKVVDRSYFSAVHRQAGTTVTVGEGAARAAFDLPRVSDGMAQNAALALCAALALGVPAETLRPRLRQWRPAALRGEWRREGGRAVYLDCYNANPASMADALAAFCSAAPEGEPRLFILGGMEELGADAERYHRALGRGLRLRPDDFLLAIGAHAEAVRAGTLEAGSRPAQAEVAASAEAAAARLAGFHGAVFIKGSRQHALERLVPAAAEGAPLHA